MNKSTVNKRILNKLLLSLLGAGLSIIGVSVYAQSSANYGYSAEGKLLGVTSNRDSIVLQWDALGRNSGKIVNGDSYLFGYNGQGLLSSYLDPKGLSTQYSYNGFGFAVSLSSPDTGFTSFTSNLAGAVTQKATSGSITNITYDAEDRIASKTVSHPTLGALTYSYAYGAQGSGYATGNLVSVSATGQSISFEYNAFSDVTKKTQSVAGSATLSSQYSYSSPGLVSGIAYPSGRVATYSRDAAGRISGITVDGTTIVSNVLYSPHGVAGWTFGNGNSVARTFDLEGRITSVTLATGIRSYSYDARGNITAITDSVLGNATYGYDNQNRLTSANTALGSWSYAYDANGSRTQLGMNGGNYAVMVDSASNKSLGYSTPTVRSLVYNNQGHVSNMTGDAATPACGNSMQLGYNANGSLTSSTAFDAVYDDFGFRLRKTPAACAGGATTLFNYGLNGFIQGEYANDGIPIQETVWLGDIPVAVFRGIKASEPAFYIYTDNLNTPRQIMNNSSQLVWSWDGEPFGATPANGSVSPATTFTYNLRFPGQYYDQETGYHQNRWREYDPKQGKYLQSDPLGLAAGVNTYAYVGSSPLMFIDPLGLWSTKAHNYFIDQFIAEVMPELKGEYGFIAAIKEGSSLADSSKFQKAEFAYMHAMTSPALTIPESQNKMCSYVKAYMEEFKRLRSSKYPGHWGDAYRALGMALHPIMDSTSPEHSGFKYWPGMTEFSFWGGGSSFWGHGGLDFSPSSNESLRHVQPYLKDTLNKMKKAFSGDYSYCGCL